MDALVPPPRPGPEFGQLLAILFMKIDAARSIVIHVTAVGPGEDTAMIARDIALAAAATPWCKVALLDARPDRPGLANERNGELIERLERGETIVLHPDHAGQGVLATGQLGTPGGAAPRAQSLRGLYGALRASYNLVVVACPPVLSGPDAAMLAAAADGTLLVVQAERTLTADILRARELLDQLGAAMLGVVLNGRRRHVPDFIARFL